jgi:hypothetical protein
VIRNNAFCLVADHVDIVLANEDIISPSVHDRIMHPPTEGSVANKMHTSSRLGAD